MNIAMHPRKLIGSKADNEIFSSGPSRDVQKTDTCFNISERGTPQAEIGAHWA